MPHLIVEYSDNLTGRIDIQGFLQEMSAAMGDSGLFPLAGTRVRAYVSENYVVADDHPQNGFIHMTLKIGVGRTEDQKTMACQMLFDRAKDYLGPAYGSPYFALSLELVELNAAHSLKANAIAPRLKQ